MEEYPRDGSTTTEENSDDEEEEVVESGEENTESDQSSDSEEEVEDDEEDDDDEEDEEEGIAEDYEDELEGEVESLGEDEEGQHPEDVWNEEDKERDRAANRRGIIACIICCFCLLLVGGAVALGVLLGGSDDEDDSPVPATTPTTPAAPTANVPIPTQAPQILPPSAQAIPTPFPSMSVVPTITLTDSPTRKPSEFPTLNPTQSAAPTKSVPDELILNPNEDTYVYADGFDQFLYGEFGDEDTMLVQNGPVEVNEIPDAYILMTFDLTDLPQPDRITNREKEAILILNHVVPSNPDQLTASTYTVVRLPETNLSVENLHGGFFSPPEGLNGTNFVVNPTDTQVQVDITSLLFGQPPYTSRRGRYMQEASPQLFLMIENQGPVQEKGGDRFSTRESTSPPILYITLQSIDLGDNETWTPTEDYPSEAPTTILGGNETMVPTATDNIFDNNRTTNE